MTFCGNFSYHVYDLNETMSSPLDIVSIFDVWNAKKNTNCENERTIYQIGQHEKRNNDCVVSVNCEKNCTCSSSNHELPICFFQRWWANRLFLASRHSHIIIERWTVTCVDVVICFPAKQYKTCNKKNINKTLLAFAKIALSLYAARPMAQRRLFKVSYFDRMMRFIEYFWSLLWLK